MAKEKQTIKTKNQTTKKILVSYTDLSKKSLTELIELRKSLIVLIDYYDNCAKSNTGNYNYDAESVYQESKKLSEKYNKCLVRTLNAIENKVIDLMYEKNLD